MSRDTFDFMDGNSRQRERFGDNESNSVRGNDSVRSNLVELALTFRLDKPLSIGVSNVGEHKWHWLPKSKIEYEMTSATTVNVTMPGWLAKDKGLV